jgi:hypothetical protein
MTVHESLSACLVLIQSSRRRAPARNADVRSTFENNRDDAGLEIPHMPTFSPVTAVRGPRTIASRPHNTPKAICCHLKSHR